MMKPFRYLCGICHENVGENQAAIFCIECNSYVHIKFKDTSILDYRIYQAEPDNAVWFCKSCTTALFPFGTLQFKE